MPCSSNRKGRGNKLILIILTAFVFFWLPYHIINILQVTGLLQDLSSVLDAAKKARPNVIAFAYFSSAVNPVLYVFAGSSHIRRAGLGFMARLFEGTNSESGSFSRGASRSSSTTESSFLNKLRLSRRPTPSQGAAPGPRAGTEAESVQGAGLVQEVGPVTPVEEPWEQQNTLAALL
ncbi:hypothetical protein GJAV_G00155640 [Gymnothorax javanicus]|nr:hypothetical protein GJAV_G00155640 [Gymnothorax javanicus]